MITMPDYKEYSDTHLLSLLAQDDGSAFEEIYSRYWLPLYDSACQRLKDKTQAEDIVQDIFVKFWFRRKEAQIQNLTGYLHTAVRYSVFNYIQRDMVSGHFYEPFENVILADASGAADMLLMEKELMRLFHSYIDSLPGKRRQIFLLHIRENLTAREIAEKLGLSPKTVHNQLATVMQGLRGQVAPVVFAVLVGGAL